MSARAVPLRFMLAVIAASALLGEWYPFSPFPMYARLPSKEEYLCVVDAGGRIVSTRGTLGISASSLKKAHRKSWNRLRDERRPERDPADASWLQREAGETLLARLLEARPAAGAGSAPEGELILERVRLAVVESRIVRSRESIARFNAAGEGR